MAGTTKYLKIIRYLIIVMFFTRIFRTYVNFKIPMYVLFVLCPLLITNDVIRNIIKKKNDKGYYISLASSIIGAAALRYFTNDFAANIYLFYYPIEILYIQGKNKQFFLAFHCILYLAAAAFSSREPNITGRLTAFGMSLLTYSGTIFVLYLSHAVRKEREETKKLNEELKSSNIKLREYSLKVEELSTARERERVAQELHDSLGHSLMALAMHLEFAEKVLDTKPEKAKEVILKAKGIAKNSTASLRLAVDTLNKERNIEGLRDGINELMDGFKILGNIKFNFSMDKYLEALNPDVKLCIYKTIRESITNGIKHGNATAFNIEIRIFDNRVNLNIKNNGAGCSTIIKSNGLRGIENRILALGGTIDFTSGENCGFTTNAEIPIYEVEVQNTLLPELVEDNGNN